MTVKASTMDSIMISKLRVFLIAHSEVRKVVEIITLANRATTGALHRHILAMHQLVCKVRCVTLADSIHLLNERRLRWMSITL
jgi:hypothetical protein